MPLESDLKLDISKFDPARTSPEVVKFNEQLVKIVESGPKWYEVGAARYREMRWNNETALPRPPVIEAGRNETIPSRDKGRDIPVRIFVPDSGKPKGIFMHIHGGGWVLQSEHYQDGFLNFMAQKASLAVVSIGYRLAPEDPYPAGPNDCHDAADYLATEGPSRFGAPLLFIGGESAGAHLSAVTLLHLASSQPALRLRGLLLHFGCYDLAAFLPAVHHFDRPLIIHKPVMTAFREAFCPGTSEEQRRDPAISPFYAHWRAVAAKFEGGLPPALFTCGTEDPLVDDSVLMAAKYGMAGGEATLKIYTGAPHGFIIFDGKIHKPAEEGMRDLETYLLEKMK